MLLRPTLGWSLFKLLLIACSTIPLLISDNSFSCSALDTGGGGYTECLAFCYYDGDITCKQEPEEAGINYNPEYCESTNTHSINTHLPNGTHYCSATVESNCFDYNYYIILAIYVVQFMAAFLLAFLFKDFDPQSDMVTITKNYDINSASLTTLLHPVMCTLTIIDFSAIYCAYTATSMSYISCDLSYDEPEGVLKLMLTLSVVIAELYTPVAINAINVFINPESTTMEKIISPFKLDLCIAATILRLMQIICWPAALLSYVSIMKRKRAEDRHETVNLLAMDVRESFTMHVLSGGSFEGKWSVKNVLMTLCTRYTVQYSFMKLLLSIMLSVALNHDYAFCNNPYHDLTEDECPSDCRAHCVFPKKKGYDYYPTHSQNCFDVQHMCFCENWLMTDLNAILFNTLHFLLQCYYLLHYNNFDPQQNQIDCVQSYTFVGENITLFLAHPAICFLSVLECAVLYVSWNAVILELGVVCGGGTNDEFTAGFLFAMLMTLLEVYKANMTVATNAIKDRSYIWAVFSLFRVDLFIFFGATLFLQTCLFPFSIIGYFTVGGKCDPTRGRESVQLRRENNSVCIEATNSFSEKQNGLSLNDPLLLAS